MVKQSIIIVFIIAVLSISGFILYEKNTAFDNIPGGDSDKHGCKGSTGSSWCEAKNKCLRQWEEACEEEETPSQEDTLLEEDARAIAEKNCIKEGEFLAPGYYNDNSKTWWFDANLNSVKEGCNPACVVSEETGEAEINWRCAGLITP